ncbi:kinase-like protein [Xylaria bambusicola]|uniref:kinase-like protein n=1 Tax=Xylaria bambusicola TaxID=326684 RepID=UPI002007AAAD|nr:kinase-like protein [Xylaria bambusicola]KAI0522181.1 kinase-like protein [Xylaria bambusicola]
MDSGDEERQDGGHNVPFVDESEGQREISDKDKCDRITSERFKELLTKYPDYIREVYRDVEQHRFVNIPRRLEGKKGSFYLTKDDLINMDRWIQKRGTPLDQRIHESTAKKIHENDKEEVEKVTQKAFKRYQGPGGSRRKSARLAKKSNQGDMDETITGTGKDEDFIEAMKILKTGLTGVHRARANLLLSIPFYKTVPYCSRALYRWLNWSEEEGWAQSFTWTDTKLIETINKVRKLAADFKVDAVDVEKVSFVLERDGLIEGFRRATITKDSIKEATLIADLPWTRVYSVEGPNVGIQKEKKVAIKRIYKSPRLKLRFLAEVTISNKLTKLSPEHFVEFYGWNETQDFLYVAMELVEEGDLEKSLREHRERWNECAIRAVTKQILEGLRFMHEAYIVHRDLKPQNILVVSSKPARIKIADFGISKRLSNRGTTVFQTGIGTNGYKAPEVVEQWRREGDESYLAARQTAYTFNVDIWSLGCIVYRMAKREHLFTDNYSESDPALRERVKGIKTNLNKERRIGRTGIDFVCGLIVIETKQRPDVGTALERLESWEGSE